MTTTVIIENNNFLFYENELNSIKKKGLFRERKILNKNLIDLASNDYLNISQNKKIFEQTVSELRETGEFSPKASMFVNGYHEIHSRFETNLSYLNSFEKAIVFGSGFLANFGIIEALVRNGDFLCMDSEYHASGVVATKNLKTEQFAFFEHNSAQDLDECLAKKISQKSRKIVAVEGIYSMSGDILNREIFEIANNYNAILIVDEAHSFGVIGENLLGVFDFYNIKPRPNHIKMGTLGKAVGSYGAYILASQHLIEYLENRTKSIIYSTALSIFDTLFAHNSINYIYENREQIKTKSINIKKMFADEVGIKKDGLIFPIEIGDSKRVLEIKKVLESNGFIIGAIRPPTVERAILRIIGRHGISDKDLKNFIYILKGLI